MPHSSICKLRACSYTANLLGLQTPSLGGRATGLPCVARPKAGQSILAILTRFGVDERMQYNSKRKAWATVQLRFEHTIKGELPPKLYWLRSGRGQLTIPQIDGSYRDQPHYLCQQLSWVYTTALHSFRQKAWAWDGLMKATWKGLFIFRVSKWTVWDQITGFKWLNKNK